jgi:hypothetical protein
MFSGLPTDLAQDDTSLTGRALASASRHIA